MLAVGALWRALLGEDEDESRALWFPAGVSPHERFVQLRALALGVSRELEPRERRVRGRLHAACLTGAELHSWLLAHGGRYLRARRLATPAPRDADEAEADADVEAVRAMLAADERLCRCFAHSIEHARDAVGDAFRKAVRGHAALGLTELISYARAHGDFPGLP